MLKIVAAILTLTSLAFVALTALFLLATSMPSAVVLTIAGAFLSAYEAGNLFAAEETFMPHPVEA